VFDPTLNSFTVAASFPKKEDCIKVFNAIQADAIGPHEIPQFVH